MADNKKGVGKIYKCPLCFGTLNDVTIDADENGIYRCVKCGYHSDFDGLMAKYAEFRSRYKLAGVRITLEEQIKM